jgi:hypothetical protein
MMNRINKTSKNILAISIAVLPVNLTMIWYRLAQTENFNATNRTSRLRKIPGYLQTSDLAPFSEERSCPTRLLSIDLAGHTHKKKDQSGFPNNLRG